jgi:hypothetical protein
MKKSITYDQLYIIEQDIQSVKQTMPSIYLFMENKFHTFLHGSANKMHFKVLHTRMHQIQQKYIVHDEKDNPIVLPYTDNQPSKFQFLESVPGSNGTELTGEAVEKAYFDEANEFLNRQIVVEL